jgi:hypothetical protein
MVSYIDDNKVVESFIVSVLKPLVTHASVVNNPFDQTYKLRLLLSNGERLAITINEPKHYITNPQQLADEVYHYLYNEHPELLL